MLKRIVVFLSCFGPISTFGLFQSSFPVRFSRLAGSQISTGFLIFQSSTLGLISNSNTKRRRGTNKRVGAQFPEANQALIFLLHSIKSGRRKRRLRRKEKENLSHARLTFRPRQPGVKRFLLVLVATAAGIGSISGVSSHVPGS